MKLQRMLLGEGQSAKDSGMLRFRSFLIFIDDRWNNWLTFEFDTPAPVFDRARFGPQAEHNPS
jgi:hypothetical protein